MPVKSMLLPKIGRRAIPIRKPVVAKPVFAPAKKPQAANVEGRTCFFFTPEDAVNFQGHARDRVLGMARQAGILKQGGELTLKVAEDVLEYVANEAINRRFYWWKAMRPHETIPAIANFKVPEGDFSVGIEHEIYMRGDDDIEARKLAIGFLKKCKYACADSDGACGAMGAKVMLEATFPPVLFSQLNANWDTYRYLKYLKDNNLTRKNPDNNTGIHVNMAGGGKDWDVKARPNINAYATQLTADEKQKYFGRVVGYPQFQRTATNTWVEFRMFASTVDPDVLMWYVKACTVMLDNAIRGGKGLKQEMEEAYKLHQKSL